jgi:hypothetical protein
LHAGLDCKRLFYIGSIEKFKGLVLNGFTLTKFNYCGISYRKVETNYLSFLNWAAIPGNLSQGLQNCP